MLVNKELIMCFNTGQVVFTWEVLNIQNTRGRLKNISLYIKMKCYNLKIMVSLCHCYSGVILHG